MSPGTLRALSTSFPGVWAYRATSRYPNGIFVEGADTAGLSSTSTPAESEDDFFSTWDKPKAAAPNPTPVVKAAPPVVGPTASNGSQSSATLSTSPAPRTTSSTASRPKLGASRLGSSTAAPSARPAKLGAKKATGPIDFAEAERRAQAEEERIKQLGYNRKKEEEEERKRVEAEQASKAKEIGKPPPPASPNPNPNASGKGPLVGHKKGASQDMARLGMGMNRLGFGAVTSSSSSAKSV